MLLQPSQGDDLRSKTVVYEGMFSHHMRASRAPASARVEPSETWAGAAKAQGSGRRPPSLGYKPTVELP